MIRLAISGCKGRMGQRITQLAHEDKDFRIVVLLEHHHHPEINTRINDVAIGSNPDSIKGADVVIEFTTPEATMEHLQASVKHKVKMVIGTTGLNNQQIEEIKSASKKIAIVFASNMSVGVNILFKLIEEASKVIPNNYNIKIVEAHHIHKKDAPSGTAKTLAEIIEKTHHAKITDIQSIREGEIVGDHEVLFESPEDMLKIRHHAKSRDIFAKGALVATKFLEKKDKGLFNMQDVLGLND